MPVIPCPTSRPACSTCPDDFPVLNLSAEEPDSGDDFIGFWDGGDIPIGNPFSSKGCSTTVFSNISQADADNKAKLQAKLCNLTNNGPPPDGCTDPGQCQNNPDGDNNPDIPTPIARNAEQRASCDSGDLVVVDVTLPYFLTTDGPDLVLAPNVFTAFTQAEADALALNYVENYLQDGLDSGVLECGSPWLWNDISGNPGSCNGVAIPIGTPLTDFPIGDILSDGNTINSTVVECVSTGAIPTYSLATKKTFGPYTEDKLISITGMISVSSYQSSPPVAITQSVDVIVALQTDVGSISQGPFGVLPGISGWGVTNAFNGTFNKAINLSQVLHAGNVATVYVNHSLSYVFFHTFPASSNSVVGTITVDPYP